MKTYLKLLDGASRRKAGSTSTSGSAPSRSGAWILAGETKPIHSADVDPLDEGGHIAFVGPFRRSRGFT